MEISKEPPMNPNLGTYYILKMNFYSCIWEFIFSWGSLHYVNT